MQLRDCLGVDWTSVPCLCGSKISKGKEKCTDHLKYGEVLECRLSFECVLCTNYRKRLHNEKAMLVFHLSSRKLLRGYKTYLRIHTKYWPIWILVPTLCSPNIPSSTFFKIVSENYSCLGCEAVQPGINSTGFLRNILPRSSENTALRNISKFPKMYMKAAMLSIYALYLATLSLAQTKYSYWHNLLFICFGLRPSSKHDVSEADEVQKKIKENLASETNPIVRNLYIRRIQREKLNINMWKEVVVLNGSKYGASSVFDWRYWGNPRRTSGWLVTRRKTEAFPFQTPFSVGGTVWGVLGFIRNQFRCDVHVFNPTK